MNDIMSSCLVQNKAPRLLALILDVAGTQHERLYGGKEIRTPASRRSMLEAFQRKS